MSRILKSAARLVIIVLVVNLCEAGTYSGGDGKIDNPYKISKPEDILELGVEDGDWGGYFVLTGDIDMKDIDFNPIAPTLSNNFGGSLDGRNFTISNLRIQGEKGRYVGLFGAMGRNGKIHNLNLKGIDINVSVPDSVEKDNFIYVGGFAGNSSGEFVNCSVSGIVSAKSRDLTAAGGFAGRLYEAVVNHCESDVNLRALSVKQTFAGGMFGYCYMSILLNNLSNDDVYAAGSDQTYAGGLTGYALHSTFGSCCADSGGVITDTGGFAGGITGYNYNGQIANCYAVNGVFSFSKGYAGGLAGGNYHSIIRNSYFAGRLSKKTMKSKPGTIAGINVTSQIDNCYWNYDTALVSNPIAEGNFIGNVTMLTSEQIKAGGLFSDPQWNADSPVGGPLLWEMHDDRLPTLTRSAEHEENE